jgi:predicted transcriptional regulator
MGIASDIKKYLKTVKRNRSWFAQQAGVSQATISRILSGDQNSLVDETKFKIYAVIDNERGEHKMDERFLSNLEDNIAKLIKQLGEVIDENRKLTKRNQDLVERILERETPKAVNGD